MTTPIIKKKKLHSKLSNSALKYYDLYICTVKLEFNWKSLLIQRNGGKESTKCIFRNDLANSIVTWFNLKKYSK